MNSQSLSIQAQLNALEHPQPSMETRAYPYPVFTYPYRVYILEKASTTVSTSMAVRMRGNLAHDIMST